MTQTGISIIVPVYSGAQYLEQLTSEIATIRDNLMENEAPFAINELIFVDDAAIDSSPQIIDEIAAERDWVVALHLSRNFGQHAATNAGILHSAGGWVVTMDEDLQHPTSQILSLFREAVEQSVDLVYANALNGVHKSLFRDLGSRGFKRLMSQLINNPNIESFSSFRMIRGSIARAAASVSAHDTYLDVSLSWFTQRVEVIDMELTDTRYVNTGKSGYSFRSFVSRRGGFVFQPDQGAAHGRYSGFSVLAATIIGMIYSLSIKLFWPARIGTEGWTSLFLTISFFGGLSALTAGITLQYLSTLVLKAHGKPRFFVVDRSTDKDIATWFARENS